MIQQHEDDGDDDRHDQHQPPRCALLVLELAAVFDVIAGRQRHVLLDPRAHLVDEAAEIAAAHVRHDDDAALAFVALDLLRAARHADVGDLIERHLLAGRRAQQDRAHRVGIGAIAIRQPQRHGIALLAVDHLPRSRRPDAPAATASSTSDTFSP